MNLRSQLPVRAHRRPSRPGPQVVRRRPNVEPREDRTVLSLSTPVLGGSNDIHFSGDAAADSIAFSVTGGLLQHNLGGQQGFNSNTDLDSSTPGDQVRAVSAITSLTFT